MTTGIVPKAKVLFVNGEPFNKMTATGITVSNLFHGWPKDRLAQIYTADIPTNRACFALSERISTRNLMPFQFGSLGEELDTGGQLEPTSPQDAKIPSHGISSSLVSRARYVLAPWLDFLPYRVPTHVLKKIQEFQPDVIYTLLGNIRITRLANAIGEKFDLPVIPHFMDDWYSTYSVPGKSMGTLIHRILIKRSVSKLFDRVPLGLTIGNRMALEYSERFHRPFYPFMNPVDSVVDCSMRPMKGQGEPMVFIYVGGLHLYRDKALKEIINVLRLVNLNGVVAELRLYVPDADRPKAEELASVARWVKYCGSVKSDQVGEVLIGADIAIHVESSSEEVKNYTRLSVSTKIPQYLAAGLPVLAYASIESASSSYVSEMKCGIAIESLDKEGLVQAVERLTRDASWRAELAVAACRTATTYHLASVVRANFSDVLWRAVRAGRET